MVEFVKPSVFGLWSIRKMKYTQVENRATDEEWANSVGTGLDWQASRWPHQIRTFPDVAVRRQHVENNTPGWKVRT